MKVYSNHIPCEDPINYLGFEELSDLAPDNLEFYYGGHPNPKIFEESSNRKIFFSTEEQSWDRDTTDSCVDNVEQILTICPPSLTSRKKRKLCFFPFDEKVIPKSHNKYYDVIYTGTATGEHVSEILDQICKYNYRFVSFGYNPRITNHSVSYLDKLDLVSKSKIGVVHNLTGTGTPQVKTRIQECAIGKAIMLCKKDPWNIIEEFFEPDKEFIYYSDGADLNWKISQILANYDKYIHIAESAYLKAVNNYTTRHFIKKYLNGIP